MSTKTKSKSRPVEAEATKHRRALPVPASVTGLLCKQQVRDALGGCSPRKIDDMIAKGEFPRADSHLGRLPRWSVELLNAWIKSRIAGA